MKQQTFIVMLEDENRKQIAFERFNDKKLSTVTSKILALYSPNSSYHFLYKQDIEKCASLAIYETPNGGNDYIERSRYSKAEFVQLLNKVS